MHGTGRRETSRRFTAGNCSKFRQNVARFRLYRHRSLQLNTRFSAFFQIYKICILLHRCNLKILVKNRFEKSAIFVKIQQHFCKCGKICQNLPEFTKFQKFQLDNLVAFEKCCKTRILLQKSVPIQPTTSSIQSERSAPPRAAGQRAPGPRLRAGPGPPPLAPLFACPIRSDPKTL